MYFRNVLSLVFITFLLLLCSCKSINATHGSTSNTNKENAITTAGTGSGTVVNAWLTTPDSTNLINQQAPFSFAPITTVNPLTITVDDGKTFQPIDGFGFALTSGSATLLNQLGPNQSAVLNELFGTADNQLGISYLRISIGASDLSAYPYTYDEVLPGSSDINLNNFFDSGGKVRSYTGFKENSYYQSHHKNICDAVDRAHLDEDEYQPQQRVYRWQPQPVLLRCLCKVFYKIPASDASRGYYHRSNHATKRAAA